MKANWLLPAGFVLVLTFFSTFADPLNNWHWRNPLPNGNPPMNPPVLDSIVFANGEFVAVGQNGVAAISTDGTDWSEYLTATANNLSDIIYGDGLFVASGENGTIETSTDGSNWVNQFSGTASSISAVTYANGKYVAVGATAVISSPDAVNWSPAGSGLSGATGVAGGTNGFVAINGSDQIYFSPNGFTWTTYTFPGISNSDPPFPPIYFGPPANHIVTYDKGLYLIGSIQPATSLSEDFFILFSLDGVTWSSNVVENAEIGPNGFSYNFFMAGNGESIAAGTDSESPFLLFSTNGINWQLTHGIPSSTQQGSAGAYGNGTYVLVPPFFTSTNALDWTNSQQSPPSPVGPTSTFTSIAFSNGIYVVAGTSSIVQSTNGLVFTVESNTPALSSIITLGSTFVGVGAGGLIYQSGDGVSWTQRNSGTLNNLYAVTAGGSLAVAVGDNGTIQTSSNGNVWTSRSSGSSLPLFGVTFANGLYVAVGQEGTVLTSPDGINWTAQYSGQLNNLLSITYGSAGFLATGVGGTIINSPDAANWTSQSAGVSSTFESATFGNGYYLLAGSNSVVVTSPDGVNWTPRNIGATGGQSLLGAAFLNSSFEVVGSNGAILESDPVTPLFAIQMHSGGNWLTTFAESGSTFRIQTTTNLAAPVWIDAASFNNVPAIMQWTNPSPPANQLFYRAVSP